MVQHVIVPDGVSVTIGVAVLFEPGSGLRL